MQQLANRTPDQLTGDESLVLGGAVYAIHDIRFNNKRQRWMLTYEGNGVRNMLVCRETDQLTVLPP